MYKNKQKSYHIKDIKIKCVFFFQHFISIDFVLVCLTLLKFQNRRREIWSPVGFELFQLQFIKYLVTSTRRQKFIGKTIAVSKPTWAKAIYLISPGLKKTLDPWSQPIVKCICQAFYERQHSMIASFLNLNGNRKSIRHLNCWWRQLKGRNQLIFINFAMNFSFDWGQSQAKCRLHENKTRRPCLLFLYSLFIGYIYTN